MEKRTLEQLDAALEAVSKDLAPRVEELAQKSTEGNLTPDEHQEYSEVVRLNDMLESDTRSPPVPDIAYSDDVGVSEAGHVWASQKRLSPAARTP